MSEYNINVNVTPGIHPFASEKVNMLFSRLENEIVNTFSSQWYVTKADEIKIGASQYKYILIKATPNLYDLFNISAEIIVVFSDYSEFEPRTFDTFDNIKDKLELGRVENLCGVIVSRDIQIEQRIKEYNSGPETRTIIPFSYEEIQSNKNNNYLFRNKFQKYFYSRDLFAFDDALKTDLYFFGRNQLVMEIIDKHFSGQNMGLFGLRKTGKTSIIFDVKRKIQMKNAVGVFISCQSPEMSMGTWVDAIFYIVKRIYNDFKMDYSSISREDFTEISAAEKLSQTISNIYDLFNKTILLMFDEVEHITFKKAANPNWSEGLESAFFWKAVRSSFQEESSKFTYCIVGTNPICIEYSKICQAENPIFLGVSVQYIPGFSVEQTRTMVRKLGRIMGLKFDEILYSKMTEDYGGHPFLIRHLCSYISKKYTNRPVIIDRIKYNICKEEFNKTQGKYFDMLLEVLTDFYPIEYEMLSYLASGDIETFKYFANEDHSLIEHLLGYGIIQQNDNDYDFRIDVIKDYILKKNKTKSVYKTIEEKWSHLCTQRSNLELEMRSMIKQVLLIGLSANSENPKDYVISKIYNSERHKYQSYTYNDLFDPKKSKIYLKGLTVLITGRWHLFEPFMTEFTQESFVHTMGIINDKGRFDTHAKIPTDDDITIFDAAINKLNSIIRNYEEFKK